MTRALHIGEVIVVINTLAPALCSLCGVPIQNSNYAVNIYNTYISYRNTAIQ